MNDKHLKIRIQQCLQLATASSCPRAQFGAMLLDPKRNVVLMDGYNGGPRGGGKLCGGSFCQRDGLTKENFEVKAGWKHWTTGGGSGRIGGGIRHSQQVRRVYLNGVVAKVIPLSIWESQGKAFSPLEGVLGAGATERAEQYIEKMIEDYPALASGTCIEVGCHHAEMNVVCNAAASTVSCQGAWLIVTGEPCRMCAKLIHHAGIVKVFIVGGGYMGQNGVQYLKDHGITVEVTEGPKDPRVAECAG